MQSAWYSFGVTLAVKMQLWMFLSSLRNLGFVRLQTLCSVLAFVSTVSTQSYYSSSANSGSCRCTSDRACFPTTDILNQFNATVGGRLITPRPTAYPCYPTTFDAQACAALQTGFADGHYRATIPGSMDSWNLEELGSQGCPLELANVSNAQCSQGRVPVYGVAVASVSDVQATVQFAVKYNVRLFIKNTGHDYAGRSAAPGAFLLWMHKFQDIQVNKSFVAQGCSANSQPAVTVTGGPQWRDVFDKVANDTQSRYVIIGGGCDSVGAGGGYVQGGGHGALSPVYGLAVDNVLEFQIVTADGQLRVVNDCQDPDLFWALKGGGGGTFGVLISVTYKLHPSPAAWTSFEMQIVPLPLGSLLSAAQTRQLFVTFAQNAAALDTALAGGYVQINSSIGLQATFIIPQAISQVNATIQAFANAFQPLQQNGAAAVVLRIQSQPSFIAWEDNPIIQAVNTSYGAESGLRIVTAGRLIPRSALDDPIVLGNALYQASTYVDVFFAAVVLGPAVRVTDLDSKSTSVHPGWRKAFMSTDFIKVWDYNTPDNGISQNKNAVQVAAAVIAGVYPDAAEYLNEAWREPNWQQVFWGSNYPRLLSIKKKVDPNGLFTCIQCVGSEDWDEEGNCKKQSY